MRAEFMFKLCVIKTKYQQDGLPVIRTPTPKCGGILVRAKQKMIKDEGKVPKSTHTHENLRSKIGKLSPIVCRDFWFPCIRNSK